MIFDLHCDTLWQLEGAFDRKEDESLERSSFQIDSARLKKGGYYAQCFAVYIPNKFENPYDKCNKVIDIFERETERSDILSPVFRYSDFEKNRKNGKISAVLTMEDGCPIGDDLNRLYALYRRGVRMIGLTHNIINKIGYPNFAGYFADGSPDRSKPNVLFGLTEFGRALVKEMNKLGIVADVSHLSDKGFYDVIETSDKPIMASHSNARSVCGNVRNLTDDMLKKLADNGGVTGINYAHHFLCDDVARGRKTIECVIEHIKYIKKTAGVDIIALGSDFDGIDRDIELEDASYMPMLVSALEKEGFTSDEIEKITYKNALRVFKDNIK